MPQGYITGVNIERVHPQWGTYYDIAINGKTYFGKKFPIKHLQEGDLVNYQTTSVTKPDGKVYENLVFDSVSKATQAESAGVAPPPQATPAAAQAPAQLPAKSPFRPTIIMWDKQDVISAQSALNSALAMVQLLAQTEGLPFAKTLTGKKKAGAIEALVDRYTKQFHKQSTGTELELEPAGGDAEEIPNGEAGVYEE